MKAPALLGALIALPAVAQSLSDWSFNGTNTLRYEHYRATGDLTASPYPSLGSQAYDEFQLNGNLRASPFDQWRFQLSGVANDSAYRTTKTGTEIERFALVRERGDNGRPYRAEFGDFLGYYSLGALQQPMKGAQIDLQWQEGKRRQSLQLTAGAFQQSWRRFYPHRDYAFGGSWLVDDPALGRFSANLLNSRRDADAVSAIAGRQQWVGSLAAEKTVRHRFGTTTVEGEVGHFEGDHNTAAGRRDTALTMQASGRKDALNYRFRHERIGQDYQPRAGVLASDRRSLEGYLGYRFANGMDLRGRSQEFITAWESTNPSTARTLGLTLSGRLLPTLLPRLTGSVDTFVQDSFNRNKTSDSTSHALGANLAHPLSSLVTGRLNASILDAENHIAGSVGTTTTQLGAALDFPIQVVGFQGSGSVGLQSRDVQQASAGNRDLSPTLSLNLMRGPHSLNFAASRLDQDFRNAATVDMQTTNLQAAYRYSAGQHTIGAEYLRNGRAPSPGLGTIAHQLALFWSFSFDRPAQRHGSTSSQVIALATGGNASDVAGRPAILDLRPGMTLVAAREALTKARILGESRMGRLSIYDTPLIDDISLTQKLVLVASDGILERAVLLIDFDDINNPQGMMASFERVRRHFLDRLGSPHNFFERGQVSANLASDIRQGTLIRVTDWKTENGWLRLGMPRRIDGKVRIEIHFAAGMFPQESDTMWGLTGY